MGDRVFEAEACSRTTRKVPAALYCRPGPLGSLARVRQDIFDVGNAAAAELSHELGPCMPGVMVAREVISKLCCA